MFPLQMVFLISLCFGPILSADYFNFKAFESQTDSAIPMIFANFGSTPSRQLCASLCSLNVTCELFVYHDSLCHFGKSNSVNVGVLQGILDETVKLYVDTGKI